MEDELEGDWKREQRDAVSAHARWSQSTEMTVFVTKVTVTQEGSACSEQEVFRDYAAYAEGLYTHGEYARGVIHYEDRVEVPLRAMSSTPNAQFAFRTFLEVR